MADEENDNFNEDEDEQEIVKPARTGPKGNPEKRGIVYLSSIAPGVTPQFVRRYFKGFGDIDRVLFLTKGDTNVAKDMKFRERSLKIRNKVYYNYKEGWIEFKKKRVAKRVAVEFNNRPVGGKTRKIYHDYLWNIKYLHSFKWHHLHEQMSAEDEMRRQRFQAEASQARREVDYYVGAVSKAKIIGKKGKKKPTSIAQEKVYQLDEDNINGFRRLDAEKELFKSIFK